ncbi:MAG: glycosyltransferase [Blastocatellia bacterium]|nr:glycosyltransferase [Blastocatellia bacterium]
MERSRASYRQERQAHWDGLARQGDTWKGAGGFYHRYLKRIYRFLVPEGQRILEIGCGQGDLLAALRPSVGVGVDFSSEYLRRARARHPDLHFIEADAHEELSEGIFDVIILSDVLNELWDVQALFCRLRAHCGPRTRIIINSYNRVWGLPLAVAERLNLRQPSLSQNWLSVNDIAGLLHLEGFEVIRTFSEMLCPLPIPLLAGLFNRYLGRLWPFKRLALTNFVLARPVGRPEAPPSVSVIVPARNESGNVAQIFARVPEMGRGTELVFVEGHSSDDTYAAIERTMADHPERPCQLHRQSGVGKGDAVRLGFAKARGDVLMILDADLTVPPEDLPRFYDALVSGRGEYIHGVRLVYPMERQAMRPLNLIGNKSFSAAFSWLLGQPIKDTLCGTKVLWKSDYEKIAAQRGYFGDFDPFGDFDLIFGAAKLNMKIVEIPIRYRERVYGTTNIQRWRHGLLLLKMVLFAAGRIKFI